MRSQPKSKVLVAEVFLHPEAVSYRLVSGPGMLAIGGAPVRDGRFYNFTDYPDDAEARLTECSRAIDVVRYRLGVVRGGLDAAMPLPLGEVSYVVRESSAGQ